MSENEQKQGQVVCCLSEATKIATKEDLIVAKTYRETMKRCADAYDVHKGIRGAPLWHGWVIEKAYLEGLMAGRREVRKAGIDWAQPGTHSQSVMADDDA